MTYGKISKNALQNLLQEFNSFSKWMSFQGGLKNAQEDFGDR